MGKRAGIILMTIAPLLHAAAPEAWLGKIEFKEQTIPFRFELLLDGKTATGSFFNGAERVTSTAGTFDGVNVTLDFGHYATKLEGRLEGSKLSGSYGSKRSGFHAFTALKVAGKRKPGAKTAPDIAGLWEIPTESPKGEKAWRLIVQQSGAEVTAAILRVDGDTGALEGTYSGGKFPLHHFDGARAYLLDITPRADGALDLKLAPGRGGAQSYVAVRPKAAREKGLAPPTDPAAHTRVKDPNQPFEFRFEDVDGRIVSSNDERFRGKVVLVNITGSWCPNCHDEAPYLEELYKRYRALGLEIVAIDFEEAEQLADRTRLRAFIKKYGIEYTYLVAGEPKELAAKIPQAENLNSWPTTFFLGRDGKVRGSHAGFAAPASGEFHTKLKREFEAQIESLLSESNRQPSSAN
jgi:thiol-disulfide isomerase/thioredoxin